MIALSTREEVRSMNSDCMNKLNNPSVFVYARHTCTTAESCVQKGIYPNNKMYIIILFDKSVQDHQTSSLISTQSIRFLYETAI